MATKISLWDINIIKIAIRDAFLKLSPRNQIRNPVMFTVYIGSLLTTVHYLFKQFLEKVKRQQVLF